jgi:hypothetical protein
MAVDDLVGAVLVAGLVLFLVGAGAWRPTYDRPFPETLSAIRRDRSRWRWIHVWMIAAMLTTPAGFAATVIVLDRPTARALALMGAVVYALGAVCWIASLTFRLTVVPWAAEVAATTGSPPPSATALDRWATWLYAVHMCGAYVASAVLAIAALTEPVGPSWLGWAGIVWGLSFLLGFLTPRVAVAFRPPFWAHAYTGAVGVALLVT